MQVMWLENEVRFPLSAMKTQSREMQHRRVGVIPFRWDGHRKLPRKQQIHDCTKKIFQSAGEERGKKADPKEVALDMRQARDENGARIFVGKDLLSSQQIAGFFSCLATKKRKSSPSVEPYESEDESEDQNDDQKAAEAETRLSDLHGLVERDVTFRRTPNR